MHAHFRGHAYHRHSHEAYSLGVTESGAQAFTCRGAGHVSSAGLVMAFNPDDPHDGHAATGNGFTYRMIHIAPEVITSMLTDLTGAVRRLHRSLTGPASPLENRNDSPGWPPSRPAMQPGRAVWIRPARARPGSPPGTGRALPKGSANSCTTATPPRPRSPTWPRSRAAAGSPPTGPSATASGCRPATTSGSYGCGTPGGPWPAGRPPPTSRRRPVSRTRPTSPAGSAAATGSPRAPTSGRAGWILDLTGVGGVCLSGTGQRCCPGLRPFPRTGSATASPTALASRGRRCPGNPLARVIVSKQAPLAEDQDPTGQCVPASPANHP